MEPSTSHSDSERKKQKRPKYHYTTDTEREIIANVYKYVTDTWRKEFYPSKIEIANKTCSIVGISSKTLSRILKEHKTGPVFREKTKSQLSTFDKIDNLDRAYIRKIVHSFYYRGELPTVHSVFAAVSTGANVPNMTLITFRRILKHLKLKCLKGRKHLKNALVDTHDMALSRINYLNKMEMFRKEHRMIYYIDDFCLKTGKEHSKHIIHVGNINGLAHSSGFLDIKPSIYRHYLSKRFEKWFESIVGSLEQNSVIVMSQDRHHCRLSEKKPTFSWKKVEIQQWLSKRNISYSDDDVKTILLEKVKRAEGRKEAYYVDEIAKRFGIDVMRLPLYHAELNPVELVLTDLTTCITRLPKSQMEDLAYLKKLVEEEIETYTDEKWSNCFSHVIKEEGNLRILADAMDKTIDTSEPNGDHLTSTDSDTVSCSESADSDDDCM